MRSGALMSQRTPLELDYGGQLGVSRTTWGRTLFSKLAMAKKSSS